MLKFTEISSVAAYLPIDNIDTDMIIPKQFLKVITRSGLGKKLFFEMRFDETGKEKADFVLNKDPFNKAQILIAGDNFGCGSSREHAPWSLLDFGIRCIIATSFADIFYNNCFENGILPIVVDKNTLNNLSKTAENKDILSINLEGQTIQSVNGAIKFEIDEFKKFRLINGLDSIGITAQKIEDIKIFEESQKNNFPWLWQQA
ncbi:3-isopropylmalate dehydratase small subunit [Candidatus Deianiraea vastatrix]|uniref:3-isopropylmalate dehydratase small subunit n=1 Tax=Candidatus Deianiraea vastatrix TaxID=2163644 RepID=A0A5B8XDP5_9RICK|nr:3-isopropylmalate dehydratase small subunit [Candidatus Deianiraea vastatrix]QED23479.1 3-isopropylmalate dehydratase small subunit [Candidatus Deianiraea vastatrix]